MVLQCIESVDRWCETGGIPVKNIVAVLLVLGCCGCGRFNSAPKNLHEVSLAVLASVDAAGDVADKPQIPDTLQGVQSVPAEPEPTPVEESKPAPEPEPAKQTDPPSVETDPPSSTNTGGESIQKPLITCYSSQRGVHCPGCIRAKQWWDGLSEKDR